MLTILSSQAARSIENAWDWDNLRTSVETLTRENLGLKKAVRQNDPLAAILGTSAQIESVRSLIGKVAHTNTTVLIEGESGTGKELVAKALHGLSSRSERPMITLNCAAVPPELTESELFGHRKGAFTGAVNDHQGVFKAAHESTIFLDEIEAMPLSMQAKLLRALQHGEIRPVGEQSAYTVDVRVIAASNRNLALLVREGRFREDFYYRLNVFPIQIPPLRDRLEDIPVLVQYLLEKLSSQNDDQVRGIDHWAMDLLMNYEWPGNVRELENAIERAYLLSPVGHPISADSLPPGIVHKKDSFVPLYSPCQFSSLAEAVEDTERLFIKEILKKCNGNKTEAARILGLSRQGLRNKIYKYRLSNNTTT
jgi:transcriptional regulator with PAS, ATPase and Fis domain